VSSRKSRYAICWQAALWLREEIEERTIFPVSQPAGMDSCRCDVLFIEAAWMPGGKRFQFTGQLGDVMAESAKTALSYIRSKADDFGTDQTFFEKNDIHIHVPAGAVPKDGPPQV